MNWIKAFRRECLEDLELRSDWHRFIVQILVSKGYSAVEVPVLWHRRKSGHSHFGLKRIPISFFDSMAVKFILTFTKAPMRIFGSMGFIQLLVSLVIFKRYSYCQIVRYYFSLDKFLPAFVLLASVVSSVISVVI